MSRSVRRGPVRRGLLAAAAVTALASGAPPSADPLGGPVAYRAAETTDLEAGPTTTKATGARGQALQLVSHEVPSLAREPALALNRAGDVFYNAKGEGTVCGEPVARGGCTGGGDNLIFRSTDSGQTWEDKSGNAVNRLAFFTVSDPDVEVDADTGRIFWAGIAIPRPAVFAFSTDNAETWTTTEIVSQGDDHETIVTGNVPEGSSLAPSDPTFPKIVYYCAHSALGRFASCARSLDGGLTFMDVAGRPLEEQSSSGCSALAGFMSADDDGRIFIGGANCGTPQISVSEDAGDSFTDVTVSQTVPARGHDVEVAPDTAGNVYALWTGVNRLPYLAVSHDHGRTFGPALLVSAPGIHETRFAALAAGDEGRVAISYIGTTSADREDSHRPWTYHVAVSTNALDKAPLFHSNVAPTLSGAPMIVNRGDCCLGVFDYLDVDVAPAPPGDVWASLSRVCSDACAASAMGVNDVFPGQGFAIEQVGGPALRDHG